MKLNFRRVGFIGTAEEITEGQRDAMEGLLSGMWTQGSNSLREVHHGDNIGADVAFHQMTLWIGPGIERHLHPTSDVVEDWHEQRRLESSRSLGFTFVDVVHPARPSEARDRRIVTATQALIVCPEEVRVDNWLIDEEIDDDIDDATEDEMIDYAVGNEIIDFAVARNRPVWLLEPDGYARYLDPPTHRRDHEDD